MLATPGRIRAAIWAVVVGEAIVNRIRTWFTESIAQADPPIVTTLTCGSSRSACEGSVDLYAVFVVASVVGSGQRQSKMGENEGQGEEGSGRY